MNHDDDYNDEIVTKLAPQTSAQLALPCAAQLAHQMPLLREDYN